MKSLLLTFAIIIACVVTASTQTNAPTLAANDQKRLQDAYNEWIVANERAQTAMLKFQSVAFESMARAKVSPDEYKLNPTANGFTLVKKEVADEKPNTAKPAATPAKPGN